MAIMVSLGSPHHIPPNFLYVSSLRVSPGSTKLANGRVINPQHRKQKFGATLSYCLPRGRNNLSSLPVPKVRV